MSAMTFKSSRTQARIRGIALQFLLTLILTTPLAHADVAEKTWQPDSAQWRWGRDRQIDLLHTDINVTLDPAVARIAGEVTLRFIPIVPSLHHLDLDAAQLNIEHVKDPARRALEFSVEDHREFVGGTKA